MKRVIGYLSIFVYLVFSQFVIKAVATADVISTGNDSFCMTKNLNTIDGKQDCREKNNSAIFSSIFAFDEYVLESGSDITYSDHCLYFECPYSLDIAYQSHAPPDERGVLFSKYVHTYVGTILLLF